MKKKYKYKIRTIDITGDTPVCLGRLPYKTRPRIGESVEIDKNGQGVMHKVAKVVHSADRGNLCIHVMRPPKTSSQVRASLCLLRSLLRYLCGYAELYRVLQVIFFRNELCDNQSQLFFQKYFFTFVRWLQILWYEL